MEPLTINNLAPYLPFGLKVKSNYEEFEDSIWKIVGILGKTLIGNTDINPDREQWLHIESIKPICFSLDNLTKPITINGETFVPMEKLRKMYPNTPNFEYIVGLTHVSNFYFKEGLTKTNIEYCVVQKLFEWKFAINLPEGSWIPVSETLNPYK